MLPDKFAVNVSIDGSSVTYLGLVLGACIIVGIVIGSAVARRL